MSCWAQRTTRLDRRPFQPFGQRSGDFLVVELDKGVLPGGCEVLLDGQFSRLPVARPEPRSGEVVLLGHPPFVHQVETRFVPAHPGDDERLEQRERVHHRPHVGRWLQHHPVDQPEGQLYALVEPTLAVREEGQALRPGRQVVLQDGQDLLQLAFEDMLLVPGEAPLFRQAGELAVEERGGELPPIIQAAGGQGDGEERRREARGPRPSPAASRWRRPGCRS